MYRHAPAKAGAGIGLFGIAFTLLTTALLFVVPELLAPAASNAYIDAWSRPVMSVGVAVLDYGIPLASAIVAYYFVSNNYASRRVVAGFAVGGLVYGLGDTAMSLLVWEYLADPALGRSLVGHVSHVWTLALRLLGGALLGVLGAVVAERR